MTRSDLFDISSIPGIEDLARAGRVAPDPGALHAARARLDEAIAAEPPQASRPAPARTSRRRWAYRGIAVAAMLTLLPLGRVALDTAPDGARAEIAADGSLQCSGQGYSEAIDPGEAELRLLPAELPAGWQLSAVAARRSTSEDPAVCTIPAMSLLRQDDSRVVTATASVLGPFDEVATDGFLGGRSTVDVAGHPGLLLDSSDVDFLRWVWTAEEHTWLMEAQGITRDEGAALAAGISTEGSAVDWQPAVEGLDLQVVAHRAEVPLDYRRAKLEWHVGLAGPNGQAVNYLVRYESEHPTSARSAAFPGATVAEDGTEARWIAQGEPEPQQDQVYLWRDGLRVSAGAGPLFSYDSDPAPPAVPSAVIAGIVDSLASVPADDPRLTQYVLDEDG